MRRITLFGRRGRPVAGRRDEPWGQSEIGSPGTCLAISNVFEYPFQIVSELACVLVPNCPYLCYDRVSPSHGDSPWSWSGEQIDTGLNPASTQAISIFLLASAPAMCRKFHETRKSRPLVTATATCNASSTAAAGTAPTVTRRCANSKAEGDVATRSRSRMLAIRALANSGLPAPASRITTSDTTNRHRADAVDHQSWVVRCRPKTTTSRDWRATK